MGQAFDAAYAPPEFAEVQKERGLLPLNLSDDELMAAIDTNMALLRTIATEAGLIN